MQGPLPAWSSSTMMPDLQFLLLAGNWNLTGPLPASWGAGSSMGRLSVLSMHDCNLKGPLPANWPSQLPQLQIIDLTNNLISGAPRQPLPQFSRSTVIVLLLTVVLLESLSVHRHPFSGVEVACDWAHQMCRDPPRCLELLCLCDSVEREEQQCDWNTPHRVSTTRS